MTPAEPCLPKGWAKPMLPHAAVTPRAKAVSAPAPATPVDRRRRSKEASGKPSGKMPVSWPVDPETPLAKSYARPETPQARMMSCTSPPPGPQVGSNRLLVCLKSRDVKRLSACLAAEPQGIPQFFWECDFEPVLCCAVRLGCSPDIVRLLLQHGADPCACGKFGHSPMTCLASDAIGVGTGFKQHVEVARLLIEAGAHPQSTDASGRFPVTVCKAAGHTKLAKFLENYLEVQASVALLRAQNGSSESPLGSLTSDVAQLILTSLLPADLAEHAWRKASQ